MSFVYRWWKQKKTKQTYTLRIATWNVRTLMDPKAGSNSDRPPRRTALVAAELLRYNIDIAAISETRPLAKTHSQRWVKGTHSSGKAFLPTLQDYMVLAFPLNLTFCVVFQKHQLESAKD